MLQKCIELLIWRVSDATRKKKIKQKQMKIKCIWIQYCYIYSLTLRTNFNHSADSKESKSEVKKKGLKFTRMEKNAWKEPQSHSRCPVSLKASQQKCVLQKWFLLKSEGEILSHLSTVIIVRIKRRTKAFVSFQTEGPTDQIDLLKVSRGTPEPPSLIVHVSNNSTKGLRFL